MTITNWQREDITAHYLEQVRGGIPFGAEQAKMMLYLVNHFTPHLQRIMDLGCGNGFLAEILLQSYPEASAILIDHSEPMIDHARIHMTDYLDRCEIIHGDFSHSIQQYADPGTIDCIVSGFAIHHLPNAKKKSYIEKYMIF